MTHLEIRLLGPMTVTVDGADAAFEAGAARALLAYLALNHTRPTPRDTLAGLLWPEWPNADALRNLRSTLYRLRAAIGDQDAGPPFLTVTRQSLQLNPDANVWVDVKAFRDAVAQAYADAQPSLADCPECVRHLADAADLVRGDLLAGFSLESSAFETWLTVEREALHRQALDVLDALTDVLAAGGDQRLALDYAQQQLALDPLRESAHRQAMRALSLSDQRAAALAQFETCCQVLRTDLGLEPDQATAALYEQIRDGAFPTEATAPTREPRTIGRCPYRGLASFREVDAPFFFGRESFVKRLAHAVATQPLVVMIVGASGAGKSSVVAAGLLPRLRSEDGWRIADLRPGLEPFHALAGALLTHLEPDLGEVDRLHEVRRLADLLAAGEAHVIDAVGRIQERQDAPARLLLLVDQFEELYTLCPDPDARRAFIDALLDAVAASEATGRGQLSLLIALRADFMGQALEHRPFADALQDASQLLGPMTREELRAAIEKPAEVQGAAFEPGLVERLLDDVADEPGHLPLLEFALTLL